MGAIDIGAESFNGDASLSSGWCAVNLSNPANDTGTITSFEIWMDTSATSGVKIGTFYGSGTSWTVRDYEAIGAVTSGSTQTFTGKSCDVETDDCIGVNPGNGKAEVNTTGGGGCPYINGDAFTAGTVNYIAYPNAKLAAYGTGETAAAGWTTAKLGGITSASIIKVAGIAVASVKKVAGVAVQ